MSTEKTPGARGHGTGARRAHYECLEIAGKAKAGCPVSKVLKACITMDASLEG